MIIECPSCVSRYRIKEDKLPDGGGNIKCPNCAHVFFVTKGGAPPSPTPPVSAETKAPDTNGWSQIPLGSAPSADDVPAAQDDRSLAVTTSTVAASGPKKWKLRNAVGLVYDFTDTEQLVRWLGSKDSHDGFAASDDGGKEFKSLSEFDELCDVRPARSKTMMGMTAVNISPPLDSPPSPPNPAQSATEQRAPSPAASSSDKAKLQAQAQARLDEARRARGIAEAPTMALPSASSVKREKSVRIRPQAPEPTNNNGITIASLIIFPLLAVIVLNMLGVINLRDLFGSSRGGRYADQIPSDGVFAPAANESAATTTNDPARPAPISLTQEQQVARLIELAGSALTARNYDSALGHLERASFLEPENIELKCQLADIYERAQRPADAARAAAACRAGSADEGSAAADGGSGAEALPE